MTDNFLSNNGYYNKGGLNGKPKEPRPIPPKGQSLDDKYELIFKQLIHERNELRKYIIDICELLDINTSQSVLGANCLEFYAVLCSTAKNKINYTEGYIRTVENAKDEFFQELKRKEQEYEELKEQYKKVEDMMIKSGANMCGELQNLYRTLDEIKEIAEKTKKDICNNCSWENTDSCDPEDYTCGEFIKILQKISEVKNE